MNDQQQSVEIDPETGLEMIGVRVTPPMVRKPDRDHQVMKTPIDPNRQFHNLSSALAWFTAFGLLEPADEMGPEGDPEVVKSCKDTITENHNLSSAPFTIEDLITPAVDPEAIVLRCPVNQPDYPIETSGRTGTSLSLSQQALQGMTRFFASHDHHPSSGMLSALMDAAEVMEAMANGTADPMTELSSLDPGVGKSTLIIHFVRALLASEAHDHVGVMICLSRHQEIIDMVEAMGLSEDRFAVLVGKDCPLNKLGSQDRNSARVLFLTQAQVELKGRGRHFDDIEAFHFRDQPRQVRLWDESLLPGVTLTVNYYGLQSLLEPIHLRYPTLTAALKRFSAEFDRAEDGTLVDVPDIEELLQADAGEDLNSLIEAVGGNNQRLIKCVTTLWCLSGRQAVVRQDGAHGNTMLNYEETLPEGIEPILVMDASGRVRGTYDQMEKFRGGLRRRLSAEKRYDNLTVHCWNRPGSKSGFRRHKDELLAGIAKTINTKPDEEWLVVCHKADGLNYDVEELVRAQLTFDHADKVHFISWGNHTSTNQFSHIKNIILAGTLFYPVSHLEALTRLTAQRPVALSMAQPNIDTITIGEHKHLVLQALSRGAVRRCIGSVCTSCDAYIIAAQPSGIPGALPDIFPGCRVETWTPIERDLKGQVGQAFAFLRDWFEQNPTGVLPYRKVQTAIGVNNAANFTNGVRKHSDFQNAIAEYGIIEVGRKGFLKID